MQLSSVHFSLAVPPLPAIEPTASPRVSASGAPGQEATESQVTDNTDSKTSEDNRPTTGPTRPDGTPLTSEEVRMLDQLKQTDRAVRQHEMAHLVTGGAYTRGVSYEYETGPDGQRYAVAGEVPIDYGPIKGDPDATIEKMQTVIAAALAPADPSPKDLQVAAQARQYLLAAQLEAAALRSEMDQARMAGEDAPATTLQFA
ncbi:putative metalloprotease CJM1_0395 family protein [Halomonas sp. Bachu 37]|uniref:putative metalloprotease CJM1_0395 family protein n=1 Tax=Halomonas kashgarensis TaxID=3084920 RepID=UPI0032164819